MYLKYLCLARALSEYESELNKYKYFKFVRTCELPAEGEAVTCLKISGSEEECFKCAPGEFCCLGHVTRLAVVSHVAINSERIPENPENHAIRTLAKIRFYHQPASRSVKNSCQK